MALSEHSLSPQEYIDAVTSQIRCRKARSYVAEEIAGHIEDQAAAYIEEGMEPAEAAAESVRQMGDPVSVGADMDRIHRPKPDWKLISLVALFSLAGVVIQYFAVSAQPSGNNAALSSMIFRYIFYMGAGLLAMTAIYFTDYTVIGRHCFFLWWALFLILFLCSVFSPVVNGTSPYIRVYSYLFVPLFGGILYRVRGKGWTGLGTCAFYGVSLLFLTVFIGHSLRTAFSLGVVLLLLTIAAAFKGWFQINRPILIPFITVTPVLAFAAWFFLAFQLGWLTEYQKDRILAFFHFIYDPAGISYISASIHKLMEGWQVVGGQMNDIGAMIPGIPYDYIMTFCFTSWGILPGLALIAGYCLLFFHIFRLSLRQPNRLGMIMGLACSLALGEQTICYLASNFGYILLSSVSLPFLSFGFHTAIVTYILIGFLLSIYRYKDIVSEPRYSSARNSTN